MAECKRERVPQISVEAVEDKPAMKRHATKVLMLDLEVTGHRDRFYKTTGIWLGEQLLLHLQILSVLCHANQRASCDGFQMGNKHWPLVKGGLCHCEYCW